MWIDRAITARLMQASKHFPALLLTGARQTGKTSLLRYAFPNAAYVGFDLPSDAAQAEDSPQEFLGQFAGPVIFDEIQYVPNLFRYMKIAIDEHRHNMGRFLMTGSQKFVLMKAVSDSLAGRSAIFELDTLASSEVLAAFKENAPGSTEYIWRGGYPELYRDPTISPRDFYRSYVSAYLERDVRSLLRVGSLRDFERFLRGCAFRSGQLLNLADLARDIGISGSTIRDWLSVLEASNQLILLEPYFNNPTKRMVKSPKLYFSDTGLLCFLVGIDNPAAIATSPLRGSIWETFVLGQIRRAIRFTGSAAQLYFWRDVRQTEVDFVIEQGGRLRLIEAKWAESPTEDRETAPIRKIDMELGERAADEHWIACQAPRSYRLQGTPHIRLINAYTFLDWV